VVHHYIHLPNSYSLSTVYHLYGNRLDRPNGGDDAAAVAPPPPPSRFDLQMESLERNTFSSFDLLNTISSQAIVRGEDRLTIPQATRLADALKRSTSVQRFSADLRCCSVQSIPCFVDYIRTSARLEEVTVEYNPLSAMDPDEIVLSYKTQVDQTFHAVGANPAIHKLSVYSTGSSPDAIYNLLANTTSLKEFKLHIRDIQENMAMSIAAGLSKNSSLGRVELGTLCGALLETMLSGIAVSSSIDSLTIPFYGASTASFWEAISKTIHFSSSLKDLKIDACTHPVMGEVADKVLFALRRPACTGLKKPDTWWRNVDFA
jgi:hypothetical protein